MDSINSFNLLCWCCLGSSRAAPSQPTLAGKYLPVASPALLWTHLLGGGLNQAQPEVAPGWHQVPNYLTSFWQRLSDQQEKALFNSKASTEKARKATERASKPRGPGGIGNNCCFVARCLQKCTGRQKMRVRRGAQQHDGAMREQGSGLHAQLFALYSLSLLCSQSAWEEVRNACLQPQDLCYAAQRGCRCWNLCLKDFVIGKS